MIRFDRLDDHPRYQILGDRHVKTERCTTGARKPILAFQILQFVIFPVIVCLFISAVLANAISMITIEMLVTIKSIITIKMKVRIEIKTMTTIEVMVTIKAMVTIKIKIISITVSIT